MFFVFNSTSYSLSPRIKAYNCNVWQIHGMLGDLSPGILSETVIIALFEKIFVLATAGLDFMQNPS